MKQEPIRIVKEELDALRERIITNHITAGQKASGRTINSLQVIITNEGGTLYGRPFFGTLETGRKEGRVPAKFRDIIYQWSIDKGIRFDKDYKRKSFAYLVSRKIAREGSKLYRQGGRNDIYSNEIPGTIERIENRIMGVFSTQINSIKIN